MERALAMNPTVQTFRGNDASAALSAARKALGPDAVVLDTRSIPGSLLRRPEVEVVVGVGQPLTARTPQRSGGDRPRALAPPPAPVPPRNGLEPSRSARMPDEEVSSDLRRVLREIGEVRATLGGLTRASQAGHDLQLPPAAAAAYARLVDRGVEPQLAEELVRQVISGRALTSVQQGVHEAVETCLLPCRAPWLNEERQVVALVGPTGVGKTTTLAKIAARAILDTRKRVALLSIDVYRIGAQEQLAKYGEIMNVPVLVARDRAELLRAADRVRDADLVLVDTAGRSTPEDVERQSELVRAIPGATLHLVLSAATGHQQMAAVAEAYRSLRPDRLIFTKVDEAVGPGAMLSAATRLRRPVACYTDGQAVPEDLHAVTGRVLADLVAGLVEDSTDRKCR
jgi:flagellar biosynthesis protein FlhF